jgi:hypothetical protein
VIDELLAQLWVNTHSTEFNSSVCLIESKSLPLEESILVQNATFLWFGLLSEKASVVLDESSFRVFKGRVIKLSTFVLTNREGFAPFLKMLDEFDDVLTTHMSSSPVGFEASQLLSELRHLLSEYSLDFWRTLSPFLHALVSNGVGLESALFLRQLCCLLSKVELDRSDLLESHYSSYRYGEEMLTAEACVQRVRDPKYWTLIRRIQFVLRDVIKGFVLDPRLAGHGPGAVSHARIRTPVEKYLHFGNDARLDYLLRKEGHGSLSGFTPFELSTSDRTSRTIFVPKTWKKLRGISAEPVELQFFQQAIYRSLMRSVHTTPLNHVINLRDQKVSGLMALQGSRDGSLATIDLSSASDSITLQLVKDVFGSTSLCRWLLATRSTHTLLGKERMEIQKFAPMGSACCFPIQCLLFAAIALATVIEETGRMPSLANYQVFGDDIICPSSMAPHIMESLTDLGFTVNPEKSYWTGFFRESCGVEAWCGHVVTPLRVKDFSLDFSGTRPLSYAHHSRTVAYINALFDRGYGKVRTFLLKKFLACSISLKGGKHSVCQSVVFGDGSHGTISSTHPTNHRLKQIPIKGYCRWGWQVVMFRPKHVVKTQEDELLADEVNYFEWLLKSSSVTGGDVTYDLAFFRSVNAVPPDLSRVGMQIVPAIGEKDPWYDNGVVFSPKV